MKKVSIVMCTYNGEAYLREQLDSLLAQSYPIYELIVQDDGSTDRTLQIAMEYKDAHPELSFNVYLNPIQKGFNRNFFSAYQNASGDLIASCDQDDIWKTDKIETLVREMEDSPFIFHNSILFNSKGELGRLHKKRLPEYPHPVGTLLMPQSFGHQMMFRKEALPILKHFEEYNLSYDYFLNTLCACLGRIKYMDEPLVYWRRHDNAATYSGRSASTNRLRGYLRAVYSLFLESNRYTTCEYFKLCAAINFPNEEANEVVSYMSKGSLRGIFKAGWICVKRKEELVPDQHGFVRTLRAFFIPMFFVRDYGRYILRP